MDAATSFPQTRTGTNCPLLGLRFGVICTGSLFMTGLIYMWLAFLERAPTSAPPS